MDQQTLILLKPDAIHRGFCGEIIARFERAGLRIQEICYQEASAADVERHYADLKKKNPAAFERNRRYLLGKSLIALVLSGPNAIAKARSINGPTDPLAAPPGTIRGDLSSDSIPFADAEDRGLYNLVHASDSAESAKSEIGLWFHRPQ